MLDMHSHILPGLDDGAPDMETALEMARMAVAAGVHTVVATPHYMRGTIENSAEIVRAATLRFQQALDREGIALKVLPGAEVYLDPAVPDLLKKGELMTINNKGNHLLMELPMGEIPRYVEDVLFEIKVQGVTPIIAHPERNLAIIGEPRFAAVFVEKGCLLQINAGSVLGYYGVKVRKTARVLIRRGLVLVMGSDMHTAGERCGSLKGAGHWIKGFRPGLAEEMLEHGVNISEGKEIQLEAKDIIRGENSNLWRKLYGILSQEGR